MNLKSDENSNLSFINSQNKIMETPIIYSNDSVVLRKRSGFFNRKFTPLLNVPLNGSAQVSEEYQKAFNGSLNYYKKDLHIY